MSIKNMRRGIPSLFKEGTEHLTGLEAAVIKNLRACKELADITRTSLGPNGMNKLIVNHLERIFVTSDCATIMRELEVAHPAAKMVVMAASMQEAEIGDGSNFVVCFAGELLHNAEALIRMGLHPSEIITGYQKAAKKALEVLDTLSVWNVESKELFNKDMLLRGISGAISAKQYGQEGILAGLVAEACLAVMPKNASSFVVDNIRVCKVLGGNVGQSEVVRGMVIGHDTLGSVKKVKDAKIAVFTESIKGPDTETKGTIEITSAEQLISFNSGEEKEMEKTIRQMSESGVKVVVTGGSVDDIALHFLEKYGIMAVKITSKHDLRRLCKTVKARAMVAMGAVPPQYLGFCSSVYTREVGSRRVTVFAQDKLDSTPVATILLRASTENTLNDVERAVDDGVNVVRAMSKDGRFVAGGGAVEIELARQLSAFGTKSAGLEQYALKKFAESFEVVPKTLAENAGLVAVDTISQLYAAHERGDTKAGISIDDGKIVDLTGKHIVDLLLTKQQAIKLAVDAAITVLRVDQIIQAKPAGGPKLPQNKGNWDED